MKKKLLALFVIAILVLSTQSAFAYTPSKTVSVEYFENGDYIVTIIEDVFTEQSVTRATTVTKSKTLNYNNANGETLWYVKVTGMFSYGDGTAKCLSSSPSAAAPASSWNVYDIHGSKSGATASATATGKQTINGIVTNSLTRTVTLTCSPTGVFS